MDSPKRLSRFVEAPSPDQTGGWPYHGVPPSPNVDSGDQLWQIGMAPQQTQAQAAAGAPSKSDSIWRRENPCAVLEYARNVHPGKVCVAGNVQTNV